MKAVIAHFRQNRHRTVGNHMIVRVDGVEDRKKASDLLGKTVVWKSPKGKEIKGKVAAPHGNKGAVRVIFEKGMPGQSITQHVEIS